MTKDYHLTKEQAITIAESYGNINWIGEVVFNQEQLHAFANAVLDSVFDNRRVVFFPANGEYPIEHNPHANKNNKQEILAALNQEGEEE